jgi:transcriptional regulator with XRE-family HTH domain
MATRKNEMTKEEKAHIHYVRKAARQTQAVFAAKIGIHLVTLSRLENFRIIPSPDLAETIGKVTNQSPGEVIDDYLKHRRTA